MLGHPCLPARFWAKVQLDEKGCWLWTGALTSRGYGCWQFNGSRQSPHRTTFENLVGPIPDGLTIDHLCKNRPCCNPDHLEPVTQAENNRRAKEHITHCPQGHPYTGENLTIHGGRNARVCITCRRQSSRDYRARLRVKVAA